MKLVIDIVVQFHSSEHCIQSGYKLVLVFIAVPGLIPMPVVMVDL